MSIRHLTILIMVIATPLSLYGQDYRREGIVLGGAAGAIAGGIIGHQNDETPEGRPHRRGLRCDRRRFDRQCPR